MLLHTGSQCKTLSNDCAFLTCITMLSLIKSQCCTTAKMTHMLLSKDVTSYTLWDNKVRELIAVKVLHTSLLITTLVAFKVGLLPLGSYAPIPAPSPPFKTILELVLWNGLQSCRCITPDVINIIKMPSFQYFLIFGKRKKSLGARSGE